MIAAVFLGRIHHALKLSSIVNDLINRGVSVNMAITNNSVNIDPPNEFFKEFGITKFSHVQDVISLEDVGDIDRRMEELSWVLDLPRLHKTVSPFWIAASLREALMNIVGFTGYLEEVKPDFVIGLHEQNFFAKTMFYAAQKMSIPTYSLQEGILLQREEDDMGRFSTGTTYTTELFSWSEYDSDLYKDAEKIIPVGPTHLDELINLKKDMGKYLSFKEVYRKKLGLSGFSQMVVLAPPRANLYVGDLFDDLRRLSDWCTKANISMIIRPHPFEHPGIINAMKEIALTSKNTGVDMEHDGTACLLSSDAIITQTSTVAVEGLCLGIPVIELDSGYNSLEQPLHSVGAATLLQGDDLDVIRSVLDGRYNIDGANAFRKERVPLADGMATKRMLDRILR